MSKNTFTSNMSGRETARLTITQNGVETEYEPFGSDVEIEIDAGLTGAALPLKIHNNEITNNGTNLACTGDNAWAEGKSNEATGDYSHAEGQLCKAKGQASHAGGQSCETSGQNSFAHGVNLKTSNQSSCQAAFGMYNSDQKAMFVIGNGTANNNRKDAFKVDSNGNTWVMIDGVLTKVTNASGVNHVNESYTSNDDNVNVSSSEISCVFKTNLKNFIGEVHVRFQNSGHNMTLTQFVNGVSNGIISTLTIMSGMTHATVPVVVKNGVLKIQVTFDNPSTPSGVKFDLVGYNM